MSGNSTPSTSVINFGAGPAKLPTEVLVYFIVVQAVQKILTHKVFTDVTLSFIIALGENSYSDQEIFYPCSIFTSPLMRKFRRDNCILVYSCSDH